MSEYYYVKIFNKAVTDKGWIRLSDDCEQWLKENIGNECLGSLNEFKYYSDFKWFAFLTWDDSSSDYFLIYFKNKDDAILFKLIWGGK